MAFKIVDHLPQNLDEDIFQAADFTWLGLIGLRDDLRDDSAPLLAILRESHIEVKIITGDTRLVGVNIAQ